MDRGGDAASTPKSRWGFWASLGFGLAVGGLFVATQVAVIFAFALASVLRNPPTSTAALVESLSSSGLVLAFATVLDAPVCVGAIYLFVRLRRGLGFAQYVGFNEAQRGQFLGWLFVALLFALGCDAVTQLLGRPLVPNFMVKAYRTAYFAPFLWFALVVVAPLFEEIFYRGFLFEGIRNSKGGPAVAVVLTSLLWTSIHTQYEAIYLVAVFVAGLLLGLAKLRTNSLSVPVAMHALVNFIAMVDAHLAQSNSGHPIP